MQAALPHARADRLPHEFAGPGVRGMGLNDHGISGGQSGSRVTSSNREGERKVAGTEERRPDQVDTDMERMSGLGAGLRSGSARSMRAPTHDPSSTTWAKKRNWLQASSCLALQGRLWQAVSWCPRSSVHRRGIRCSLQSSEGRFLSRSLSSARTRQMPPTRSGPLSQFRCPSLGRKQAAQVSLLLDSRRKNAPKFRRHPESR